MYNRCLAESASMSRYLDVYAYIMTHPGETIKGISRGVGCSYTNVRHHLNTLLREGRVVRYAYRGSTRHFTRADAKGNWAGHIALRNPATKMVFETIRAAPYCTQTDIIRRLRLPRTTVQYQLDVLTETELAFRAGKSYFVR